MLKTNLRKIRRLQFKKKCDGLDACEEYNLRELKEMDADDFYWDAGNREEFWNGTNQLQRY